MAGRRLETQLNFQGDNSALEGWDEYSMPTLLLGSS